MQRHEARSPGLKGHGEMNNNLLLSVMRSSKEYRDLENGLAQARTMARQRPFMVTGLSEGASPVFVSALAAAEVGEEQDRADQPHPLWLLGIAARGREQQDRLPPMAPADQRNLLLQTR